MLPSISLLRKVFLLTIVLVVMRPAFSQEDSAIVSIHLGKKTRRDPVLLVQALTAGKDSEMEKFDALFSWVATNIKYDYRQYFSGQGSNSKTDVGRVLRRQKAICGEYADLMNVLCEQAGIHSVTVTGYAKDRLFDINDTIFFDNHAWNAVELDGRWHLYDVTWSAGGYIYRLTWFGQIISDWQDNIYEKRERDLRRKMVVRIPKNKVCKTPKHKEVKRYTIRGLPFLWRKLYNLLGRIPLRLVIDEGEVLNRDYYLTDPNLFAITHFPSIPYWSLTTDISSLSEFASDSSYYYFDPKQLLIQDRGGTPCPKCDAFFDLTPIEQKKHQIGYTLANNPRNGIASSTYAFAMADLYFAEIDETGDSLQNELYFDSTLQAYAFIRKELGRSRKELTAYHKFHFAKEKSKLKALVKENKAHTDNNIENVKQMRTRAKKVGFLYRKLLSCKRSCLRYSNIYRKIKARAPSAKPLREKGVDILLKKADKHEVKIDSLNAILAEMKPQLLDKTTVLGDKVLLQNKVLDPQVRFFYTIARSRIHDSYDDRHKWVNDIQDSITALEIALSSTVLNELLLPTDTLLEDYLRFMKIIRMRDAEQQKVLKIYARLYTGQYFSLDEFEAHRTRFLDATDETFCYFFKLNAPFYFYLSGFDIFWSNHYRLYHAIKTDNRCEARRYRSFLDEVLLNKRRVRHVVDHNMRYQSKRKQKIKKTRHDWLEKLRAERKAEKKAARKRD